MKIRVTEIQEITYELDVTPERYCEARAQLSTCETFHGLVYWKGKIVNTTHKWESIHSLEPEKLEEFFDNKG